MNETTHFWTKKWYRTVLVLFLTLYFRSIFPFPSCITNAYVAIHMMKILGYWILGYRQEHNFLEDGKIKSPVILLTKPTFEHSFLSFVHSNFTSQRTKLTNLNLYAEENSSPYSWLFVLEHFGFWIFSYTLEHWRNQARCAKCTRRHLFIFKTKKIMLFTYVCVVTSSIHSKKYFLSKFLNHKIYNYR